MTYQPDFSGCWAKLARAMEHRNTLKSEVEPGVVRPKKDRIRMSAKYQPRPGYYIFRVAEIPETFMTRAGILIGDVAHNLRCVLDHLVWQLTLVKTNGRELQGARARRARFPILDEPLEGNIPPRDFHKSDALKDVRPEHREIIEGFQPYNRTDALSILRILSDRDKHRVITPVLMRTQGFTFEGGPFEGVETTGIYLGRAATYLELGAEIMRVKFVVRLEDEVEMAGYATPRVMLPQGGIAIYGLDRIAACVTEIVREFEPLF
jgi:hypothetical protein